MLTLKALQGKLPGLFKTGIREHPSANQSSRAGARIRLAVIHTTESADDSYEAICDYLSRRGVAASSHYVVDCKRLPTRKFTNVSRLVAEDRKAWTALSANGISINYELIGRASRTRSQWLNLYRSQLRTAAALVASDCIEYDLPVARAYPGVCGHGDLDRFGFPNSHTDPGAGFPWDVFLAEVQSFVDSGTQVRVVKKKRVIAARAGNKHGHDYKESSRVSRALGRILPVRGAKGA